MNKLTAVIPIGDTDGNLFSLKSTLEACDKWRVKVVVVHDNFFDKTERELDNLLSQFVNVELVRGVFRSPGRARNVGLSKVESEWFCFWDIDDIPIVEEYVSAITNLKDVNENLLVGHFQFVNKRTSVSTDWKLPKPNGDVESQIALNPGIWRFLFKTEDFKDVKFGEGLMGEDQLFLARASGLINSIGVVTRIFYKYSINLEGQLSSKKELIIELFEVIREEEKTRSTSTKNKLLDYLILRQCITLLTSNLFYRREGYRALTRGVFSLRFSAIKFIFSILTKKQLSK